MHTANTEQKHSQSACVMCLNDRAWLQMDKMFSLSLNPKSTIAIIMRGHVADTGIHGNLLS